MVSRDARPPGGRPARTSKLSVASLLVAVFVPPVACCAGLNLDRHGSLWVGVFALATATVMPVIAALRLVDHHGRLTGAVYSVVAWIVVAIWWLLFTVLGAATGMFGGRGWIG